MRRCDGREVEGIRTVGRIQLVIAGSGSEDKERAPSPKECRQPLVAENKPWLTASKEPGTSAPHLLRTELCRQRE